MAKHTPRGWALGSHANRFKQPEFIPTENPWSEFERFEKFCPDCAWEDCHKPRFFDMPVCQLHALEIYGRIRRADEDRTRTVTSSASRLNLVAARSSANATRSSLRIGLVSVRTSTYPSS